MAALRFLKKTIGEVGSVPFLKLQCVAEGQ
jgi:hypothetical protein